MVLLMPCCAMGQPAIPGVSYGESIGGARHGARVSGGRCCARRSLIPYRSCQRDARSLVRWTGLCSPHTAVMKRATTYQTVRSATIQR